MPEANNFDTLYARLNAEQASAVDLIEGPVMVLAGPGTGKTQVLAMRIANILRKTQMDPWNILCLTFTESGVVAMRERLFRIIGRPAYQVRIHTFHSFCNDIIREHPEVFASHRESQALSDIDRVRLLRGLIDRLPGTSDLKPFGAPYMYLRDISGNVQALKQEGVSPEDFGTVLDVLEDFSGRLEESLVEFSGLKPKERTEGKCAAFHEKVVAAAAAASLQESLRVVPERYYAKLQERLTVADGDREAQKARTAYKNEVKKWLSAMERQLPKQRDLARVYGWYGEELGSQGRYDFEDMIIMVLDAWKKHDWLLAEAQEQFQYVLADEYQDTNGAQNEVLMQLGSFEAAPNMFVVGDDKQSIYRFQGASLSNMLDFYEHYKNDLQVVALKNNYRSQETVLEGAGAVISHNEESVTKYIPQVGNELVAAAGLPAEKLQVRVTESEGSEDAWVVREMQRRIEEGVEPEELAVLYRYHRDGQELLRLLALAGVPARLEAGEDALADGVVGQLLTELRLLVNPNQSELLAEIVQYPWWGWSDLDALKLVHMLGSMRGRKQMWSALADEKRLQEWGLEEAGKVVAWVEQLATWRRLAQKVTLQDLLHHVVTESGMLDYILHEAQALEGLERLSRVLEEAKQINTNQRELTLEEFVDYMDLLVEHGVALMTNPWQAPGKAVRLMTAHKAKGLEFDHVIMTRANDKHWGNNREVNKLPLPHGLVRYDMVVANENNEDERRLWYVAMTRAKRSLTVTRASHTASGRETTPSIFLGEIPEELKDQEEVVEEAIDTEKRLVESMQPVPIKSSAEVARWAEGLLENYVMSVTHLNNYLECPYQFYIKNLLRVPSARSVYQALGTAAHEALQDFMVAFSTREKLPARADLLTSFERHLEGELLTKQEFEDLLAVGQEQLGGYYDRYKDDFSPYVITELDFRSHGVRVKDLALTGKIDRVELLDAADAEQGKWRSGAEVKVVDYKTGSADKGVRKLKRGEVYWRQMVFYKLLCDASEQFSYQMKVGEVDFIRPSDKKGFIRQQVKVSEPDVEELKGEISRVWEEMQALRFLEAEAMCGECEVCVAKNGY